MKPDTLVLPKAGAYVLAKGVKYHISIGEGGTVQVRLVDHPLLGTPRVLVHMPAGNKVEIFTEPFEGDIT